MYLYPMDWALGRSHFTGRYEAYVSPLRLLEVAVGSATGRGKAKGVIQCMSAWFLLRCPGYGYHDVL